MGATVSKPEPAEMGRRVLVLGREPELNGATKQYLEYCGHEVLRKSEPGDALREAARMRPHVVVCALGRESSRERVAAVSQIHEDHGVTVVLVTSLHRGEVAHRFPRLKVNEFLRKPLSLSQLEEAVSAA